MALLLTYPFVLYPEPSESSPVKSLRKRRRSVNYVKAEYKSIKLKQVKLAKLRQSLEVVRWISYAVTGITFFAMLRNLLAGDLISLVFASIFLVLKSGLIWLLDLGMTLIEEAAKADRQQEELDYWSDVKAANQDWLAQAEKNSYKLEYQGSNNINSIQLDNINSQVVYTRGEQRDNESEGVSEKFFRKYLEQYFHNCEISNDYFPLNENYGYTTDFTLIPAGATVAIDIEIDEPYEGKSKRPHHCQDNKKDYNRNIYFLERGWIIIRFSEFQVVHYPDACCKEIAKVLAQQNLPTYLEDCYAVADLPSDNSWTKEDALVLAKRKFRETYLEKAGLFKQYPNSKCKSKGKKNRLKKRKPTLKS